MADDQKQAGGGEDPWAGIDADASSAADGGFEFPSFDQIDAEQIDTEEAVSSLPGFEDAAAEPAPPGFDALSLGANDGVFTDDAAWAGDDIVPVDVDIEPDQSPNEPPLAVFPPVEASESAVFGGVTGKDDADALAHLEHSGLEDSGPEHSGPGNPGAGDSEELPVFADDESAADAIAFESVMSDGEPSGDVSLIGKSTVEVGTDHSGIVPFDDWDAMAEQAAATPSEESSEAVESVGEAFEEAFTEEAFGEPGDPLDFGVEAREFGGVEDLAGGGAVADESADIGFDATTTAATATAVAGTVPKAATKRPPKRRSSGGGGALAAVAVLLGGVLSIPIVFALLFWVFRKDPLNIAPKIPQSLSFLLPSEFQIAGGPKAFSGASGGGPLVASRPPVPPAIDPQADEEPMPTIPPGEPSLDPAAAAPTVAATAPAEPAAPGEDDLFPDPVKAAPVAPVKPPLDTAAFDDAVASALDSTGRLLESDEADPDRKTILRSWYLSLAKVGEEAAAVEKSAIEAGHEFDPAPEGVARVIGGILADEKAAEQFDKVARMWMRSPKRTSDGVILPATMSGSKQVGPWWFSKVVVGEGDEASEVSVVSRTEPVASEGDRVVVLGLVFEPDTVWAAACRRFEPKPLGGDEEAAVPEKPKSDDLFPLE